MLNKVDAEILEHAVNELLSSFDPMDAMQSFQIRALFTDEEFNQIRSIRNWQSKICTFFRIFVRKSDSLQPLRDYFRKSPQYYLADVLCGKVPIVSDPSTSSDTKERTHPRILHSLSETMVPPRSKHHVNRPALVKRVCNKLVSLAPLSSFWLVIDGIAGSGKTSLIVDVLRDCPHLLSMYYSDVVWIRDGCIQKSQLMRLYSNTRVLVTQAESLESFPEDTEAIKLAIAKALSTMSFPLLVLDEVYLEESARWFDSLNCRIVATTSRRGAFRSAGNIVERISLDSSCQFSVEETRILFTDFKPPPNTCFLNNVVAESGGNPALLVKMKEMSRNRTERLQRCYEVLKDGLLCRLKCSTSYPSASLDEAIEKMTLTLTNGELEALQSLTIFEPGTSFSLSDAVNIMPLDVCGRMNVLDTALETLDRAVDCNLLEEVEMESDTDSLGEHYRYQMCPIIYKYFLKGNTGWSDTHMLPDIVNDNSSLPFSWLGWSGLACISVVLISAAYIGLRKFRQPVNSNRCF